LYRAAASSFPGSGHPCVRDVDTRGPGRGRQMPDVPSTDHPPPSTRTAARRATPGRMGFPLFTRWRT
jgi:hypothetical protein